jgi:hypothetical protein
MLVLSLCGVILNLSCSKLLGHVCVWSMERNNLLVKSLCGRQKGCIYPGKVAKGGIIFASQF